MNGGRRLTFAHLLEEEDQRRRHETKDTEEAEVMRIGNERRLLLKDTVKHLRRLVSRLPKALVRGKAMLNRRQLLLINRVVLREVTNEHSLVTLGTAGD